MIEQWLDNSTIASCANATISAANGEWHESRVLPFISMTLKGWVTLPNQLDYEVYSARRCGIKERMTCTDSLGILGSTLDTHA